MSNRSALSNEALACEADAIALGIPSPPNTQRDVPADVRKLAYLVSELFRRLPSMEDDAGEAGAGDPCGTSSAL